MLPKVRITRCGHQSNNPIIISSSPIGAKASGGLVFGSFRNPGPNLCVQGRRICVPEKPEFITGCSECLSFLHCQYTASLDLDTFPEIYRSAIIGNYDCEKVYYISHTEIFRSAIIGNYDCEKVYYISHIVLKAECFNLHLRTKYMVYLQFRLQEI